ncbi:MAG: hypothetical protein AVO39_11045 [delta proteobacterium MLS_D]|nr:MAG: hypothetical protein AVO39_11045 [delta proteobacterium MLS_D]
MSNVRILYDFLFDSGTITSSSEVTGLPDDNAVHDFIAKKWRTTGDSAEWITFDLGAATKITMLAIFGHNLTGDATVLLQGHTADSWGDPDYSQALTIDDHVIILFLDKTYRYWHITIADGSNPDGYIEAGRICAGEYYEPGVNVTQEVQKQLIDPSILQESEGRQGYAIERDVYRVFDVTFADIDRDQQEELIDIFRDVKNIHPLVFALDPDDYPNEDTLYCKITTPLTQTLRALEYGDVPITFEEKVA